LLHSIVRVYEKETLRPQDSLNISQKRFLNHDADALGEETAHPVRDFKLIDSWKPCYISQSPVIRHAAIGCTRISSSSQIDSVVILMFSLSGPEHFDMMLRND
jgi:hypothetical protein